MMMWREQPPPRELALWVESAWSLETDGPVQGHGVPPDGCLDLVYDRRNGLRAIGAMTVEQRIDFPGPAAIAGIRFRPGMAGPFLRLPPAELTDGAAPFEAFRPAQARNLVRRLDDVPSMVAAMEVLLAGIGLPAVAPTPVQRAIGWMTAAHGCVHLDGVAAQANLSPRQFRRRCHEASGLTPKLLCRVLRFRQAYKAALCETRPDWSAIALDHAYFDQAHLIQDFRAFTGRTPMAVFSNTREAARA